MTLALSAVTVRYGHGRSTITAVENVDLVIPRGSTVGIVGESGCGKSTLARALVGLVPLAGGTIHFNGVPYIAPRMRASRRLRQRVQMVFQDPYSSLNPRMTVGDAIGEALAMTDLSPRPSRDDASRLLDLVGLPLSVALKYPHQLSGGQRQRVAIARALAVQPDVVINDEITSALDVSVQASILNLLRNLQSRLHLTYLFISHDLSVVRYMSDAIAVMYLGRIVEAAATLELFDSPRHPYTRALLASVPQAGEPRKPPPLTGELPDPRRPPTGCRFHTRCPIGPLRHADRTICIDKDPSALASSMPHHAACHFAGSDSPL